MSQRNSIISGKLDREVVSAFQRHRFIRLYDSKLDAAQILHALYAEPMERMAEMQQSLPTHAKELFEFEESTRLQVVVPIPEWGWHRPQSYDSITSFKQYRAAHRLEEGVDQPHKKVRGLALSIQSPFALPITHQYMRGDGSGVGNATEGLILSPDMVGVEQYDTYMASAIVLDKLIMNLNYMEEFAKGVSKLCTTYGITKRLWPECGTFLGDVVRGKIDETKIQPFPKYAKAYLRDYTTYDEHISVAYLHAQLKAITDVVLAAQLMPDAEDQEKDASKGADGQQRPYFTDVCIVYIK